MKYLNLKRKYSIKIPTNVSIFYCNKKKMITFVGPLKKRSLKLEVKVLFPKSKNLLIVTSLTENRKLMNKKEIETLQGTTVSIIKQILIEINYKFYQKLKLIGVGYRAFTLDNPFENQIFLKLGYSHLIYFKIPNQIQSHVSKFSTLFLFGNSSYQLVTSLTSSIRDCKLPEPYKGKGILYSEEQIKLKKGKKI